VEVGVAAKPSYNEIHAALSAPDQFFEIESIDIAGVLTRTWKNAPVNLAQVLEQGAQNAGSRDFIVLGDERMTHERHFDLVNRLATTLVDELGIQKGDRVAIAMRNLPEWSVAFFAVTMIGAIAVPLNAFWNGEELAFAMSDCQPRILFADGERLERLAAQPDALEEILVVGTNLRDRKGTADLPGGSWTSTHSSRVKVQVGALSTSSPTTRPRSSTRRERRPNPKASSGRTATFAAT
jgi:long-chain acyl-CoA synthetase